MLGDSAYGGVENCNAVRDSGRRTIIDSRSNAVPHGLNAKAEMLRFRDEHPGTFYGILRTRNNVESVFSSMKERFGGVVRALNAHPIYRTAVDVHLLQHDLRVKAREWRR